MSSDDIPKVPERPQKHRTESLTSESSCERTSSPLSASIGVSDAKGSESPKIPARRPQRLKTSSNSPVLPTSIPQDLPSKKPSIPESRPRREKKEIKDGENSATNDVELKDSQGSSDHELVPQAPVTRPQRVKTNPEIPAVPSSRPLAKSKTVTSIDEMDVPEELLNRKVKRSTTENLDMLVQNTSEQLKEMELLLSKHDVAKRPNSPPKSVEAPEAVSGDEKQESVDSDEGSKTLSREGAVAEPESVIQHNSAEQLHRELSTETGRKSTSPTAEGRYDEARQGEASEPVSEPSEDKVSSNTPEPPVASSTASQADPDKGKETMEAVEEVSTIPPPTRASSNKSEEKKGEETTGEPPSKVPDVNSPQTAASSDLAAPAAKRGAPPVPKKPSSKIAAFQQMLQKQQLEQLQGPAPFQSRGSSPSNDQSAIKQISSGRTALSDDRARFGKNLGTLFANPGMMPGIPASTVDNSESSNLVDSEQVDHSAKTAPSGNRQRRARGPRGRKLPSQVASIEKVQTETNNEIELFSTWTIVSRKSEGEPRSKATLGNSENEVPELWSDGTQERRPSVLIDPGQPVAGSQQVLNETEETVLDEHLQKLASVSTAKIDKDLHMNSTSQGTESPRLTKIAESNEMDSQHQVPEEKDMTDYSPKLDLV